MGIYQSYLKAIINHLFADISMNYWVFVSYIIFICNYDLIYYE